MKIRTLLTSSILCVLTSSPLLARHTLAVVKIEGGKPVIEHLVEPPTPGCTTTNTPPSMSQIGMVRTAILQAIEDHPALKLHYQALLKLYASHEISLSDLMMLTIGIDAQRSTSEPFEELLRQIDVMRKSGD